MNPDRLQDFIDQSGVDYSVSGDSFVFTCPHCNKRKLYMRRTNGQYICFYCADTNGTRGRAEFALADLLHLPVHEIRKTLYGYQPTQRDLTRPWGQPAPTDPDETPGAPNLPALTWPYTHVPIDDPTASEGRDYLQSRGVDLQTAIAHGLHHCRLTKAVCFPISRNGNLVGWQERHYATQSHGRKVTTSSGLPKSSVVMFENNLVGSPHAILCEGPIDALQVSGCGGAIATLGKLVSPRQRYLATSYGAKRVYLALDTDAVPEMRTLAAAYLLEGVEVYWMRVPAGRKDFGECSPAECAQAFATAIRVTPSLIWHPLT